MPITVATRKGVSALAAEADDHRVVLTSHGRPVAVVDSAGRLDEDVRSIREAARAVTEAALEALSARLLAKLDLAEICGRLGVSMEEVRLRASELGQR